MKPLTTPCIPCGLHKPSRNTYYNGKLLVERDFSDEQIYHIAKQRLLNQVLHGSGTVCGLKVKSHPVEECRDKYVYVEPGIALDCCGREIIVPQKSAIPLADLIANAELSLDGSQDLFIALCYKEQPAEVVPLILPDCDCGDQGTAPNRIHESFEFQVFAEAPGQRVVARPPLKPRLEWTHTISLSDQSPRAIAVDDQYQQLYVATQVSNDGESSQGARIFVYRKDNHDLITALAAGDGPVDLVTSGSGELIYLAGSGLKSGDAVVEGIAVYKESKIRQRLEPEAVLDLEGLSRLAVSRRTGALFALQLTKGQLKAWSEESINAWLQAGGVGAPGSEHVLDLDSDFSAAEGAAIRGAAVMDIDIDGRFLFVADPNAEGSHAIKVVNIGKLFTDDPGALMNPELPGVDADERAIALRVSRIPQSDDSPDGLFVYLLTQLVKDDESFIRLRRFQWSSATQQFLASGRGGQWPGEPRDLALAPDEKWAYVLEIAELEEGPRSQVDVASVDEIASVRGGQPVNPLTDSLTVSGAARFGRLTGSGQRLYVAADDAAADVQPERGLVAVLGIEETDCDALFLRSLDGCPNCRDKEHHHCVVLAHLPRYTPGQKVQDPGEAADGEVALDNFTYRPLVASTSSIVEVIRCMLDEGFAAGLPGPRGPAGENGAAIVEVTLEDPQPAAGSPPTARLEDVGDAGDNRRLVLGLPPGADGPRGPGIVEIALAVPPLAPGAAPTVAVEIVEPATGDFRLTLGIPPGEQGPPGSPGNVVELDVGRITAISWKHNAFSYDDPSAFQKQLQTVGLVIAFDREVEMRNLIYGSPTGDDVVISFPKSLVFELLGRRNLEQDCWCPEHRLICEPVKEFTLDGEGRITNSEAHGMPFPRTASAIRLRLLNRVQLFSTTGLFRVVFRADFAIDAAGGLAIDGNHIGGRVPGKPSGNGTPGGTFFSWFAVGPAIEHPEFIAPERDRLFER